MTRADIARMIDLSAVRANDTEERVAALAESAKKFQCALASVLPGMTPLLIELLNDGPDVCIGANLGFPSGGDSLETKLCEARELLRLGCDEFDMVINIGMLLSGKYPYVENEIRRIVDAVDAKPVKVIIECYYLSDDAVRRACELCIRAGAAFIKTGTGWTPTGATLQNISLIKSCVGDDIGIKASGGIRELKTLVEMYRRGARRFGIGLGREVRLFEQIEASPEGVVPI